MIIAGIDEAGYGPLLGPLVVSATGFDVPWAGELPVDVRDLPCCWKLMKQAIAKKPPVKKGRVLIADSKVVHALTDGNRLLERGVLTFARVLTCPIEPRQFDNSATWHQMATHFNDGAHEAGTHEWYQETLGRSVPLWCESGDLSISTNMLRSAMTATGVTCVAMRSRVITEAAYNRLIAQSNNKATTLVHITMTHLHGLHRDFGGRGLVVGVDKQGGRNNYIDLLLHYFPDAQIKVLQEGAEASVYCITDGAARSIVHFREKGERHFLPTALASMMCKYLRESLMDGFNAWWCGRVDGLNRTAGYYKDGARWIADVEPHLERLGVQKTMLVRDR
jgi:hypothetical protein